MIHHQHAIVLTLLKLKFKLQLTIAFLGLKLLLNGYSYNWARPVFEVLVELSARLADCMVKALLGLYARPYDKRATLLVLPTRL